MKKQYKSLEVKVISLSKADVICTSSQTPKNTANNANSLLDASFDLGDLKNQTF